MNGPGLGQMSLFPPEPAPEPLLCWLWLAHTLGAGSGHAGQNMVIRVTDEALLQKTGGILQGMSGSPLGQNGMLVGAVTHVFVDEPDRGYAIFAETVRNAEKNLDQTTRNAA